MSQKRVLLIAGAGTLGTYTSTELLKLGYKVDVICLEALASRNRNLRYLIHSATDEYLKSLFQENRYDAIVDFIHYQKPETYEQRCKLLLKNTDQLVFLSSYRIYADTKGEPITESSPMLLDVTSDPYMLENEIYAFPKTKNERILRASGKTNYTIIRPLISFSHYRLDLVTQGMYALLYRPQRGKKILLPEASRNLTAGVGWAGNVGKEIARLIGKTDALQEAFTLGSGENPTWQQVADYYAEFVGAEYAWIDTENYLQYATPNTYMNRCDYLNDRAFDRKVDVSHVLAVTGLKQEELVSCRDGIIHELDVLSNRPDLVKRLDTPFWQKLDAKMDACLKKLGI